MKYLFIVYLFAFYLLLGCSSEKDLPKQIPETEYTKDNTVEAESVNAVIEPSDTISAPEKIIHIVKKGESLWVIAKKYGVTVADIVKENNIKDKNLIKINQELIIPKQSK